MSTTNSSVKAIRGTQAERLAANTTSMAIGTEWIESDTGLVYVLSFDPAQKKNVWALVGGTAAEFAPGDVTIYMNATTGNDANSGLSASTAIRTIAELNRRLPAMNAGTLHVLMAAGTYDVADNPFCPTLYAPVQTRPRGQRLVLVGTFANDTATLTNTTPDATGNVLTVAGPLTVGQYRGKYVEILSGDNAGVWGQVLDNDATTITLAQPLYASLGAGDTFRVRTPATIINALVPFQIGGLNGYDCGVGMQAITVQGACQTYANLELDRCHFATGGRIFFINRGARVDVGPITDEDYFDAGAFPCGIYVYGTGASGPGVGGSIDVINGAHANLAGVFDDTALVASAQANMNVFAPDMRNSVAAFFLTSIGSVSGFGGGLTSSIYDVDAGAGYRTEFGTYNPVGAIVADEGSNVAAAELVIQDNDAQAGVFAQKQATALLTNVTGTGNTGVGAGVENGGKIYFDAATTVSGTGGEALLGPAAPQTWASISGVATYSAVSDVRDNVIAEIF